MAVKEQSQRQLRVGQEIKKIIAGEIERGEVRNLEDIDTMVTITEARVSPDLKYCHVYIMTLNNDYLQEALDGRQSDAFFVDILSKYL